LSHVTLLHGDGTETFLYSSQRKISSAIDAGLLGLEMYHSGDQFYGGDGLVKKGVENTIATIGRLAQRGMAPTDKEIIRLMME
jgi:L-cysteine desulfidase